jgi:hypothetical protein
LVFWTFIYNALIRLDLPQYLSFSIAMLPYYSTAYSALFSSYIDRMFQYLSLSNIPLPPSIVLSDRPTSTISCSLSLSVSLSL